MPIHVYVRSPIFSLNPDIQDQSIKSADTLDDLPRRPHLIKHLRCRLTLVAFQLLLCWPPRARHKAGNPSQSPRTLNLYRAPPAPPASLSPLPRLLTFRPSEEKPSKHLRPPQTPASTMDDVSLKQKQSAADDKDLDNLIFSEKDDAVKENQPQHREGSDDEEKEATKADRSSLSNVLPVDKLKNGANTASKYVLTAGMIVDGVEKGEDSWERRTAKSSNAGKTIAGGLSSAATASSEQYGKLKETEAYKKSSTLASGAYERTSVVASGALEKVGRLICCVMAYCAITVEVLAMEVLTLLMSSLCRCLQARAASTTGLEMAKHTAAAGYETLKSKTGGKKGGE
ncbi:hypothetical protein BBJ28_00018017 [Nothophytophthora sp. Chile5]|nr:hypothetical protein BBJ28_00018017 [Nothophytophthora sp. Chile5]